MVTSKDNRSDSNLTYRDCVPCSAVELLSDEYRSSISRGSHSSICTLPRAVDYTATISSAAEQRLCLNGDESRT